MRAGAALLLLLAACGRASAPERNDRPPDLENAAIEAGVIPDPSGADITGLYARDTDRVCIVPAARDFRIGLSVDYGDGQACSGVGRATRAGDRLHVVLQGLADCQFDARFDGDRILLPPRLDRACAKRCTGRATLEALEVGRMSESAAEAATLRDSGGRLLCGG
jgi:hypothetical protein